MKKLEQAKTITQISIETEEDGNVNHAKLVEKLKQYIPDSKNEFNWLDNYKDLSNIPLPLHVSQKFVRVNDVQLLISLIIDSEIIIRELYNPTCVFGEKYVLTFAATVMIYMLGVDSNYINEVDVIIPISLQNAIISKCVEIIDDNKDTVSSIGVMEEQLFVNVVTEEEKLAIIKEASGLKKFVLNLKAKENNSDIENTFIDKINLIDTFGILDYDALALAKTNKYVVVTGEVTIMGLFQIKEFEVNGIGIINFFVGIRIEVEMLLDYMQRMLEFKFLITLTKESIIYIMECYTNAVDDNKREECMIKWINYLFRPGEMSKEYKDIFVHMLIDVFKETYGPQIDAMNPIWCNFTFFLMKYNNMKTEIQLGKDGCIETVTCFKPN